MSRNIGLDTICLRPTPRLAHTEYSMEYHTTLVEKIDAGFYDDWGYDLLWCTNDGPVDWSKGRITDLGHASYAVDGSDQHKPSECPFHDVEEVYAFDPAREYGVPTFTETVRAYENWHQERQSQFPNQVVTGGYYKSVVSGAIQAFGWEMLLMAAGEPTRFAAVLNRFADYTHHYVSAWSRTSIEVFIQHDDMVWTHGPFMHPDFYRRAIFPLYRSLWEPLKKAGKKILYCSDGMYDMFMKDIAACGADGFIFEPCNNLDYIVEHFGSTHCLVGSKVDCRTMTFGSWADVNAEMDATLALARKCPGFIWAVGNHIPANVPDEMCNRYINYLKSHWARS